MILLLLALFAGRAEAAADFRCKLPAGEGQAKLVVNAGGGRKLFVCAVNQKKKKGKFEISGFRVFMVGKNGKRSKKFLFESQLENTHYRAWGEKGALKLDELVWDGKAKVPAFETEIACDATGCHVSKPPKCVFEKPKAGSRRALEQVGEYQHGDKQGKVPHSELIDSLGRLALSGDEDAQAVFKDRGPLALDGEASENYFRYQEQIQRLKKAGCL